MGVGPRETGRNGGVSGLDSAARKGTEPNSSGFSSSKSRGSCPGLAWPMSPDFPGTHTPSSPPCHHPRVWPSLSDPNQPLECQQRDGGKIEGEKPSGAVTCHWRLPLGSYWSDLSHVATPDGWSGWCKRSAFWGATCKLKTDPDFCHRRRGQEKRADGGPSATARLRRTY